MWKKSEESNPPAASPTAGPASPPKRSGSSSKGPAIIGPSIQIKGDVSGKEDLLIEGHVEGEVSLKQHNVTIGRSGNAKADIYGKSIRVEGKVHGNLFGSESVVIQATGTVSGNITAPRVSLENGSTFKGSIDMGASNGSHPLASHRPPGSAKRP